METLKKILLVGGIYLIITTPTLAVKINEIYPVPANGGEEWIEIYNDSDATVDLNGYVIKDEANHTINLETTTIDPRGFILAISNNILNNGGDTVSLKNQTNETIDSINYSQSLDSSKSWVRCPDGSGEWKETTTITKKASNQSICDSPNPFQENTPQPSPTQSPTTDTTSVPPPTQIAATSYNNIVISEIMAYPSPGNNEWIELYNGNSTDVVLEGWYIDDGADTGSSPKQFSLTVRANGYGVVDITSSMFNNSGDEVRLLDQSINLKDAVNYASSGQNETYGRVSVPNGSLCQQDPSYGVINKTCKQTNTTTSPTKSSTTQSNTVKTPTPTSTKTPTKSQTTQNNNSQIKPQSITSLNNSDNTSLGVSLQTGESEDKGTILGAEIENKTSTDSPPLARALAGSSAGIALLNMLYIINKITHVIKI